jgi:hypothetical protein
MEKIISHPKAIEKPKAAKPVRVQTATPVTPVRPAVPVVVPVVQPKGRWLSRAVMLVATTACWWLALTTPNLVAVAEASTTTVQYLQVASSEIAAQIG